MACCQLSRFFFCQAGMKQAEHSDTTVHPDAESSPSSEQIHTLRRRAALRGKILKGMLIVLSIAFFITIYVLANRTGSTGNKEPEYIPAANSRSLEVEVLD